MFKSKKKKKARASVVCFVFLNLLVDEEELWIEWTCLVNFLASGFGNQIVLLECDFVDVLFLFCCSVLVLTKSKGKGVEDLRKHDESVLCCYNLWVIDMSSLRTFVEYCMYLWLKPYTPGFELGTDYA